MGEEASCTHLERARGTLVSFLPAHGDSRAGAVAKQLSRTLTEGYGLAVLLADFENRGNSVWTAARLRRRLDGRTWGAFVYEAGGLKILDACETQPRQIGGLMDYARANYATICADLTGAREPHALEVLRASDAIFIAAGSDHASLEGVREKAAWLRSIDLADRTALLLERTPDGPGADEVEERTGLPVCSLIETPAHMEQLARWLASHTASASDQEYAAYALAG